MSEASALAQPASGGDGTNIAELFAALRDKPPADAFRKRCWLYVAMNGKCATCKGFLAVMSLVPMKHADGRILAICKTCGGKRT